MDDQAAGFSKRKYESVNDRRRIMGEKKQKLKKNKDQVQRARRFGNKPISKKK
jgi:hypothetical protein